MFPRLRERFSQAAGTLSGGEQQMLAIGRGLMAKPRVLLLDEPTEGLAPLYVNLVFQVIQNLRAQKHTILIVEQSVHHVLRVADRAYVLQSGTIRQSGPAATLRTDPAIVQAYLGESPLPVAPLRRERGEG